MLTSLWAGPIPVPALSDSVTALTGHTLEGECLIIYHVMLSHVIIIIRAGLPQPDNRAAGEQPPSPEVCLAILNNFYADGIKWHDVACHHKKPTVCEPRN